MKYLIRNDKQRQTCIEDIQAARLPLFVETRDEADRSEAQNRTCWMWYGEAARQGLLEPQWHPERPPTPEDAHREAKLRCGVPILRRDSEPFRDVYDRLIKPLPIEEKVQAMDLINVTSIMSKDQASEYMDAVWDHFASVKGGRLTRPLR